YAFKPPAPSWGDVCHIQLRRVSLACGNKAIRKKLIACYPRSTTGSPKGLTPKTCKRPKRCWRSCAETGSADVTGRETNNRHPRADSYRTLFTHHLTLSRCIYHSISHFHELLNFSKKFDRAWDLSTENTPLIRIALWALHALGMPLSSARGRMASPRQS